MNSKIVIGIIVIVAIIVIGVLMSNNPNNNYPTTTTYTNTNIIQNTNMTIPSSTTTTMTSSMSTNTTNITYNTFYLLNETNSSYYFVFILSHDEYESAINNLSNPKIGVIFINHNQEIVITKNTIIGNYVFLIGHTNQLLTSFTIGNQYLITILTDRPYTYQFIYEGNWTGPIP